MSTPNVPLSEISIGSSSIGGHCGYCGSLDGTISLGSTASRLSPLDLESLFFAGWRRSGNYVYAIDNARSCCVAATIRLDAVAFESTKEQRKLVQKLNRYLRGEVTLERPSQVKSGVVPADVITATSTTAPKPLIVADVISDTLEDVLRAAVHLAFPMVNLDVNTPLVFRTKKTTTSTSLNSTTSSSSATVLSTRSDGGADFTSNAAFRLRAALKKKEVADNGSSSFELGEVATAIVNAFENTPMTAEITQGMRATASPSGHINIFFSTPLPSLLLPITLPSPPPLATPLPPPQTSAPPLSQHTWRVEEVPAIFDEASFLLYERYQIAVHGDAPGSVSRRQYERFLCDSPLIRVPVGWSGPHPDIEPNISFPTLPLGLKVSSNGAKLINSLETAAIAAWRTVGLESVPEALSTATTSTSPLPTAPLWLRGFGTSPTIDSVFPDLLNTNYTPISTGYGTAHHRYFLDNVLVAVAVVDITPHVLSSVYVFYDPLVSQSLPLGKLTALREIQWIQSVAASTQGRALRTYLLGYFIENCPKMKYKADYAPSEILCPVTHAGWVPAKKGAEMLKAAKRAPLVDAATVKTWEEKARLREAIMASALARTPFHAGKQILTIHEIKELAPKWFDDMMPSLKIFLQKIQGAAGKIIVGI